MHQVFSIVFTIECGVVDTISRRTPIFFLCFLFFDPHLTKHQLKRRPPDQRKETKLITPAYLQNNFPAAEMMGRTGGYEESSPWLINSSKVIHRSH